MLFSGLIQEKSWSSLLLAGCLHQSWFSLSEGARKVIPPCQSQLSDPGYDQPDCPLSDRGAGGEPAQRHKQNVKTKTSEQEATEFKCSGRKALYSKGVVCFLECLIL